MKKYIIAGMQAHCLTNQDYQDLIDRGWRRCNIFRQFIYLKIKLKMLFILTQQLERIVTNQKMTKLVVLAIQ